MLLIGYDLLRSLLMNSVTARELLHQNTDMLICDEGHRLKNMKGSTHIAFDDFPTRRRIALSGYPMQNNLRELYAMLQFVRPEGVVPLHVGDPSTFAEYFEDTIAAGLFNASATGAAPAQVQQALERVLELRRGLVSQR